MRLVSQQVLCERSFLLENSYTLLDISQALLRTSLWSWLLFRRLPVACYFIKIHLFFFLLSLYLFISFFFGFLFFFHMVYVVITILLPLQLRYLLLLFFLLGIIIRLQRLVKNIPLMGFFFLERVRWSYLCIKSRKILILNTQPCDNTF